MQFLNASSSSPAASTTFTRAYTPAAGTDRCLLIYGTYYSAGGGSITCTWNSVDYTSNQLFDVANGDFRFICFYVPESAIGGASSAVLTASNSVSGKVSCVTATGMSQDAPLNTHVTNYVTASADPITTAAVSPPTGGGVYGFCLASTTETTSSSESTWTLIGAGNIGASNHNAFYATQDNDASFTPSINLLTTRNALLVAAVFNPVGFSGGGPTHPFTSVTIS